MTTIFDAQAQIKALVKESETATPSRKETIIELITGLMAESLEPEAQKIVDSLENAKIITTQFNYGGYMQVIGSQEGIYRAALVLALKRAGAGKGLDSALQLFTGR